MVSASPRSGSRGTSSTSSYREEIEPLLPAAGLREPEITTYDVHTYLTQGPDAASESSDDFLDYAFSSGNGQSGRPVPAPTEGR